MAKDKTVFFCKECGADYPKASSVCWKNMPKHGKHQKNELSSSFYK
jgi:predicted ATP-dependent serine protease